MPYEYEHGTGTVGDPYQIWTADDLNGVRDYLDAHFIQMADVDLSEYQNVCPFFEDIIIGWIPIGWVDEGGLTWSGSQFIGKYNGNNKIISGFSILYETYVRPPMGLFSDVGGNDFLIENVIITTSSAESDSGAYGLLAGNIGNSEDSGIIRNCSVNGTLIGGELNGGFVGTINSTNILIQECYSDIVSTNNGGFCGGFVGINYGAIENCYSKGIINVQDNYDYGGFVGNNYGAIENCYAIVEINASEGVTDVDGFEGYNYDLGVVTNCYYDSEISIVSTGYGRGEPRTTAEMTYPYDTSENETYVDWDFETIWNHDENHNINDGYPHFEEIIISDHRIYYATDTEKMFWNIDGVWTFMATLKHSLLKELNEDHHTQYLNETRHDVTDRHTLGEIVPHDDHDNLSNIGNYTHEQIDEFIDENDEGFLWSLILG